MEIQNSCKSIRLTLLIFLVLFYFSGEVLGQDASDEEIVKRIVENVWNETTYDFYDTQNDEVINEVNDETYSPHIKVKSPYTNWKYWNGVINIAMLRLYETFNNPQYREYVKRNYDFAFRYAPVFKKYYEGQRKHTYPFGQYIVMNQLDDCGAMGAGLIEVNRFDPHKEYQEYIERAANYMENEQDRLPDNTFVRSFPEKWTLWGDDLYMSVVFLARMGKYYNESKYFDDAIHQIKQFTNYLFHPCKELYYHCWYSDMEVNGVAHWGRCNGWIMMAQVELLDHLPNDHPERQELIDILRQQIIGISRYQSTTGMWHQLLDKNDSYLEASCTAMFTCGIARAVNRGWIDDRYMSIALKGWEGIKSYVQPDGQIKNICRGTTIRNDIVFYYERPKPLNDIHGIGAVLLAGNEILKYNNNK